MGLERGFSKEVYMDGLKVIPIMWVIVVLCVKLIAGPLVGTKHISLDPLKNFLHTWPRNFGVAFWIEVLVAQPIARYAMKILHSRQASKAASVQS